MKLRIKEAIKEQGLTIQEVATRIGKSKQSLHGIIEKGNPTIGTLSDIAKAINVPIHKLYEDDCDSVDLPIIICPNCQAKIPIETSIKIKSYNNDKS